MPNWCDCDLVITAKKNDIDELKSFKEIAFTKNKYPGEEIDKDLLLDFEKFVPYPKEVRDFEIEAEEIENLKRKGIDTKKLEILHNLKTKPEFDFYNWHIANWGTKWNARFWSSEQQPRFEGKKLIYNFSTAWSPPTPVVFAMSNMFPKLKFNLKYYEQGMGFQGVFECVAGLITKNIHKSYKGGRGG